jgi:hypothetical protein
VKRAVWLLLGLTVNGATQFAIAYPLSLLGLGIWSVVVAFPFAFAVMVPFTRRAIPARTPTRTDPRA